ncbi:hypothetical protein ANS017_03520 [Paraclostridium bifermentans]|uniref:hypothetical protein n=1 Tax=Paraclostridium bifermentans TaxID=1490 RepID=UPI0021C27A44|nr:hypothetical protein [Paraclostridium bifermentans]GKZ03607.1 hypothetical protein ANS014_20410 [Paraclostridium bifermentans]GKZ07145.1 hypothetical protein ANS015_20280 [Paraclostridium bifermentans]GKZ08968.1 hypothetical protein ANS017_03520 [Paraclostridium bifermentans]
MLSNELNLILSILGIACILFACITDGKPPISILTIILIIPGIRIFINSLKSIIQDAKQHKP